MSITVPVINLPGFPVSGLHLNSLANAAADSYNMLTQARAWHPCRVRDSQDDAFREIDSVSQHESGLELPRLGEDIQQGRFRIGYIHADVGPFPDELSQCLGSNSVFFIKAQSLEGFTGYELRQMCIAEPA